MAIQTAIGETVRAGQGLSSITPKNDRVIRTEVVQMSDGRIHGVHVWIGPPDMEPPERPVPGPLVWDLTKGVAIGTSESLSNTGFDPDKSVNHTRTLADDLPKRDLNPSEARILSMAIKRVPGETFCSTWDMTDYQGNPITVGFVARSLQETEDDGSERPVLRAMNWRSEHEGPVDRQDHLAQRILNGLAQTGIHRALVDLRSWTLLKWLDDPAPFFDWRSSMAGPHIVHPEDRSQMAKMAEQFTTGTASGVLRMVAKDGSWTPVHVTVNRVELDDDVFAGLATLRKPSAEELAATGLGHDEDAAALSDASEARTTRARKANAPKD